MRLDVLKPLRSSRSFGALPLRGEREFATAVFPDYLLKHLAHKQSFCVIKLRVPELHANPDKRLTLHEPPHNLPLLLQRQLHFFLRVGGRIEIETRTTRLPWPNFLAANLVL